MSKKRQRSKLNRKQLTFLVIICLILIIIIPVAFTNIKSENTDQTTTEQKVPKQYHAALTVAKNYSNVMHMSKRAIKEQLTADTAKFSSETIQYTLKHLKANYNQNALKKAEEYSTSQNMSK